MNTKQMMALAVAALFTMTLASEVMARGGNGAGMRSGTQSQGSSTVRPAGSQRRDGTFLSSGTTASGATSRPANGRGVRDGSHLATPPATN